MSEISKKIYFVTGGGTGGHIYPAMAVADALNEDSKVYYVGNKRNMEFELATKKGYKFLHVGISGMPRKLNPKFFYWGMKLVRAVLLAIKYIKKYKNNISSIIFNIFYHQTKSKRHLIFLIFHNSY